MARSFLYPGRDTEALTPQERQLERLYDRLDTPNNRLTSTQFFQTPEAAQLLDQIYGSPTDRVPPGAQIISQTPGKITYRDAEGFEHNIVRKPDGQFSETTNRPAIVPTAASQGQQDFTQQLQQRLQQGFDQPTTLAQLDPETAAALRAISQARRAALDKTIADDEGRLLAGLFGRGVNESSIATNAAGRFAEGAGRLRLAEGAQSAEEELAIRQLLTTLGQQRRELQAGLYSNLTGQSNQRDIAGAGLALDRARLDESSRQFGAQNYIDQLRTQIEQQRLDAENSTFNKVLRGINAGANVASAVGGGLGAYRALTGGGRT